MRATAAKTLATAGVIAAFVALLAATTTPSGATTPNGLRLALTDSKMPLKIKISKPNEALISASDMVPGHAAEGATKVSVRGGRMKLTLRAKRFDSSPGPNGGSLAEALWIEIYKVKKKGEKRVYGGPALGMKTKLGKLSPGVKRKYRIVVSLPTTADNSLQGAGTSFALKWQGKPA